MLRGKAGQESILESLPRLHRRREMRICIPWLRPSRSTIC